MKNLSYVIFSVVGGCFLLYRINEIKQHKQSLNDSNQIKALHISVMDDGRCKLTIETTEGLYTEDEPYSQSEILKIAAAINRAKIPVYWITNGHMIIPDDVIIPNTPGLLT